MMGQWQKQTELWVEPVNLSRRVPEDHLPRKINKVLDLGFVRGEVASCYGSNGNVSVDPVIIIKLMLLLFLDNVPSERELMRVVPLRLDYLWFLGYGPEDEIPRIEERRCDCGWSFRALTDLQGRKNDSFIMPSGKTISSGFLLDATYEVLLTYRTAVKDFCLIQTSRNDVVLEVVTGDGWSADVRKAIEDRFDGFFEPGVRFSITSVELCSKTKSGKRNPIISRIEHGEKFVHK